MYNFQNPLPYWFNMQMFNLNPFMFNNNPQPKNMNPYNFWLNPLMFQGYKRPIPRLQDYGPNPFIINIDEATDQNNNFRTALWTGEYLQVTLMSINVGEEIGLEAHEEGDQFIRIEEGQCLVKIGDTKENLDFQKIIFEDFAVMIPKGKWHNIINIGDKPLKLYVIYAPPQHPRGTVNTTKPN